MNSNAITVSSAPMNNSAVNYRKEKKRRCKVLFSYQPLNEDELSLEIDDVVDVVEEVEEGWWKGILKGKVGVFPSNFVEELPAVEEPEIISSSPEKHNLNSELKPKPIKGVGYGNIFQDGAVKLKPTAPIATVAPTTIVQEPKEDKSIRKSPVPPTLTVSTDAPELPPKKVRDQARVLYSYEAQNDDELTLKEGDIINVLSKDIEDKGWWKGELGGMVGVFPDNFVQLITTVEELRPKKPDRSDKDQGTVKTVKSNTDGKHQVDSSSTYKETSDLSKGKTPSLSRGNTNKNVTSEISKKAIDEKVEKFDKMAAPPLPGKKPSLPPPLKKVTTPSNYRNLGNFGPSLGSVVPPSPTLSNTSTTTTATITNSKTVPEPDTAKHRGSLHNSQSNEVDLDRVESSSEKLVHLTANRAKNPNRRPPSHVFLKGENDKPNGELKNAKKSSVSKSNHLDPNKILSNVSLNVKESIPEVEEKPVNKSESFRVAKELEINTSKSAVDSLKRPSPLHSPGKTKSITSAPDIVVKVEKPQVSKSDHISVHPADTSVTDSSTNLNNHPKEKSAPSSDYLQLKQELSELVHQFELFKNLTHRHISELSNEVKVEKEKRLILQAEMDTLKIQLQRK